MSIVINGASESIQVALDAAPATNQLPCVASYADQGGSAGDNAINTSGTTAVTLVASPGASVSRVINSISIPNRDTATRTVTVSKVISGTPYQIVKVTLMTGYQLFYDGGWKVLDASGNFAENVTVNGGTITSNQGTAAALSGAWPVEVTDGTNVLGTSSHPVRIDPVGTTAQPVTGTFWQSTQPVSIATLPPLAAGSNAIGSVSVSNLPATQAVSGTVTAAQGAAASISGSWPVLVTNGTNALGSSANPFITAPVNMSPTGVTLTTTTAVAMFSATNQHINSIYIVNNQAVLAAGSVVLTLTNGQGGVIGRFTLPTATGAAPSPYTVVDMQGLYIASLNGGTNPTASLSANLTSGSFFMALSVSA